MKKLIILSFGAMCMGGVTTAQTNDTAAKIEVSQNQYDRYIDSQLKMDYRNTTIQALGLTTEEIEKFDPIFKDYMDEKGDKLEKKMKLIENFKEEIAEDDSFKNEQEDRADFIEDYWEIEIAEADLRKDFQDKLERAIPNKKAVQFFLWEESIENNVSNKAVADVLPAVFDLEKYSPKNAAWKNSTLDAKTRQPMKMKKSDGTVAEYRQYVDSKLKMDFRNETIKALDLTTEETVAFDDFFWDYMAAKENLLEKRDNLFDEFAEELREDDSVKNEKEDTADFLEDYWENQIAEKELRKDYFDILESKIAKEKAAKFFFWERAIENRIAINALSETMPTFAVLDFRPNNDVAVIEDMNVNVKPVNTNLSVTTKTKIENFDKWVTKNRGQVDISHDYTSEGLTALVNTVEALKNDKNVNIPNFASKKSMILNNADKMTHNWKATNHADMTKEAFKAVAEMMMQFDNKMVKADELKSIANAMDKDVLMTKQASKIYQFFDAANESLQRVYQADFTSSK